MRRRATVVDHKNSFRQYPLTSSARRLRYLLSRLTGSRLQKSQKVYGVDINGQRFKRIILRDSHLAADIEQALEAFGLSPYVPGLVIRYEHEVWVDFVAGEVPTRVDEHLVAKLAEFYAHVYHRNSRECRPADCAWSTRVQRDLGFLQRIGVLSSTQQTQLKRAVERLEPGKFWLGFDYNDPVIKNFVLTNTGELCGIDVESLVQDQLIGLGVAKALMRWMEPYRGVFIEAYQATTGPDFVPYLDFIELAQLAAYTKLMFVERKWANVDAERFERFC